MFVFFSFFLFEICANAASSDEWTWEVSVIPPDSGWDSEEGRSIRATLGWFEKEIKNDPVGLLEHDLKFVFIEDILSEDLLPQLAADLKKSKSIAVLNFASDEINRLFIPMAGNAEKPMLMAHGEDVWLFNGLLPYPYIFSIELYRDYRTAALIKYAQKTFDSSATNRIAVVASRFSLNEEREAKICERLLDGLGISPLTFWTDASNFNTFRLLEDEIRSSMAGVLFCYVGSMATREIWRGVRGLDSRYQIWYPGSPNESFLSYDGIVFADQAMKLPSEGNFVAVKRNLWVTRAVDVRDEVAAGKTFALASWLIESIKKAKSVEPGVLIHFLASAPGVPFGSQTFDISPTTHRPIARDIYILRVANKQFNLTETIKIEGLTSPE